MDRFASPASFRHRVQNALHTALLLAAMAALAGFLGWALFGTTAVVWAALVAPLFVAFAREVSPAFMLRLTGARAIPFEQAPGLYRIVDRLAARAGLEEAPRLYYLPTRVLLARAPHWLRTHPATAERIRRLLELERDLPGAA